MSLFSVLLTDSTGRVLAPGENGDHCYTSVGMQTSTGVPICAPQCPRRLAAEGGRIGPHHGSTNMGTGRLQCTGLDGRVVVVFVPGPVSVEDVVPLSDRERETLALVAEGYTDAAAASVLGVSVTTVRTLLARVRRKLGAAGRAEAVARAIATGQL